MPLEPSRRPPRESRATGIAVFGASDSALAEYCGRLARGRKGWSTRGTRLSMTAGRCPTSPTQGPLLESRRSARLTTVFEMFRQVSEPNRARGGLGVGRTPAKQLVEMNRGRAPEQTGSSPEGCRGEPSLRSHRFNNLQPPVFELHRISPQTHHKSGGNLGHRVSAGRPATTSVSLTTPPLLQVVPGQPSPPRATHRPRAAPDSDRFRGSLTASMATLNRSSAAGRPPPGTLARRSIADSTGPGSKAEERASPTRGRVGLPETEMDGVGARRSASHAARRRCRIVTRSPGG